MTQRFTKKDLQMIFFNMHKDRRLTLSEQKKVNAIERSIKSGNIKTLSALEKRTVKALPGRLGLF